MPESTMSASLRKSAGYTLLSLSCIAWLGVPVVPFMALETSAKLGLAGLLYLISQITWILCIVLLGPEVLQLLRNLREKIKARLRSIRS